MSRFLEREGGREGLILDVGINENESSPPSKRD